jgi:hypothetical protein
MVSLRRPTSFTSMLCYLLKMAWTNARVKCSRRGRAVAVCRPMCNVRSREGFRCWSLCHCCWCSIMCPRWLGRTYTLRTAGDGTLWLLHQQCASALARSPTNVEHPLPRRFSLLETLTLLLVLCYSSKRILPNGGASRAVHEVAVRQFPGEGAIESGRLGRYPAASAAGALDTVAGALFLDEGGRDECTGSGTRAGEGSVLQFLSLRGVDPNRHPVHEASVAGAFDIVANPLLLVQADVGKGWALALRKTARCGRLFIFLLRRVSSTRSTCVRRVPRNRVHPKAAIAPPRRAVLLYRCPLGTIDAFPARPIVQLYNGGHVGKDVRREPHPRDPPSGNRPPTPLENRRLRFRTDAPQYDVDVRARYGQWTVARCGRFMTGGGGSGSRRQCCSFISLDGFRYRNP